MATTTTTTNPDPEYFPFTGLPAAEALANSPYPRGYISFEAAPAITVAGAGEDQVWKINCILPIGFAYVLTEVHISMQGAIADLAGWDDVVNGEIDWNVPLRVIQFDGTSLGDTFSTTALDRRVFSFPDLPQQVMIIDDAASQVGFRIGNHTTDDAAMTGGVFVRLLQYDIGQAHHFQIHTPQLIR